MNINKNNHKFIIDSNKIPYSLDAERSILGGLLINNVFWNYIDSHNVLSEHDFYSNQHRIIFRYMETLFHRNLPVDIVTLSDSLSNHNVLEQVGGFFYIAEIVNNTPALLNIESYVRIVKEKSLLRSLINTVIDIYNMAILPQGKDIKELIDIAEHKVLSILKNKYDIHQKVVPIYNIVDQISYKLEKLAESKVSMIGYDTGIKKLNDMTSGLQPSNLIIIAARPSMGKTVLGINLAENIAKKYQKPVLIFSLEMPSEDVVMRMIASQGKINMNKLRNGNLNNQDWIKLIDIMNNISNLHIYIDDTSSLTPMELRSRSRRIYKDYGGLSMILVDYLGLMKVPGYEMNRSLEVAEISRSLKSLAKELCVPVVALSQLNREVENRMDKRPIMSDLRDSGAIEQDADVVIFIYRDEVYYKDQDDNKGLGELIIGKQRNGPIGKVKVSFQGQYASFTDLLSNDKYNNE